MRCFSFFVGDLHFAYVNSSDALNGKLYVDAVYNTFLNITIEGNYTQLTVKSSEYQNGQTEITWADHSLSFFKKLLRIHYFSLTHIIQIFLRSRWRSEFCVGTSY